jgi:geranylgeranyl diphosphate synthase type I
MHAIPVGSSMAPASLRLIAAEVEVRLDEVLDAEIQRWRTFEPQLAEPLGALRSLVMSGAKRLRPAFCHWGHVAAGGDPTDPRLVDAGAALELLQAFALLHDDVMDGSAVRRGARTAHLEFADHHEREGWRGEGRRFGEGLAVLVGDLAHVYADRLLTDAPVEAKLVWSELRIELNIGQCLDVFGTARADTDLPTARRIARYKSGKYTVERPLHLGAAFAGRLDSYQDALSAYGDPLGEAFQLRDDLLGAFGDTVRTGKPVGDDLREGKPTPLLALAVRRAEPHHRELLGRVGSADLTADEVTALQQFLEDTGARAEVEADVERLAQQAVEAIEAAPVPAAACDALVELAAFIAARDT